MTKEEAQNKALEIERILRARDEDMGRRYQESAVNVINALKEAGASQFRSAEDIVQALTSPT